jgi:hypothetical protein
MLAGSFYWREMRRRTSPSDIGKAFKKLQGSHDYMQATVLGVGNDNNQLQIARTGEPVSDGGSYSFLQAYTAPVGSTGGPVAGDRVLMMQTSEGNWIILGKVLG